ncbi:hypothetical protein [Microbacterium sp. SS28]|uniref:hypothetical protein n=1 Tax=Microbacterium sp. SS28 TaxID=2919948 RepID=UPI001FA9A826|nr:hypothetical protein [Microbacterium sp. SS28]
MHYRLMNDYGALWPFWAQGGLCGDGDPRLPPDLEREVRDWSDQFGRLFEWQHGWPDQATAEAHRAEGERLYTEIQHALPDDTVGFQYWEIAWRPAQ